MEQREGMELHFDKLFALHHFIFIFIIIIFKAEIMQLEDSAERWENWIQFVGSRMVKSFTENG